MSDEDFTVPLDDGHHPGSTAVETTVMVYANKVSSKFATVFDDALPAEWQERIYEYAKKKRKPWGVYVPTAMVDDSAVQPDGLWETQPQLAIGLLSCRRLVFGKGGGLIGADKQRINGTVVWCLTSSGCSTVEYHIDYAELHRYETNVIVPPLYAGVYQASPFAVGAMRGGDFMVNMRGLEHYAEFGYKGALRSKQALAADMGRDVNGDCGGGGGGGGGDWTCVRYKSNRFVFFDGDLPHSATPIEALPGSIRPPAAILAGAPTESKDSISSDGNSNRNRESNDNNAGEGAAVDSKGMRMLPTAVDKYGNPIPPASASASASGESRVILGFNCFPHGPVAECCARAPEHSEAFNRTVKLYQSLAAMGVPMCASGHVANPTPTTAAVAAAGDEVSHGVAVDQRCGSSSSCRGSEGQRPSGAASAPAPVPVPRTDKAKSAGGSGGGINLSDLRRNPALAKMLVLAARNMKKKQKQEQEQQQGQASVSTSASASAAGAQDGPRAATASGPH